MCYKGLDNRCCVALAQAPPNARTDIELRCDIKDAGDVIVAAKYIVDSTGKIIPHVTMLAHCDV